jgi:hypothetical protein
MFNTNDSHLYISWYGWILPSELPKRNGTYQIAVVSTNVSIQFNGNLIVTIHGDIGDTEELTLEGPFSKDSMSTFNVSTLG